MSDIDFEILFNQKPLASKSLTIVENAKIYGSYPKKSLRFYLRQGLTQISCVSFRLGRFGQSIIDNLKKSFE